MSSIDAFAELPDAIESFGDKELKLWAKPEKDAKWRFLGYSNWKDFG